MFKPSSWLSSVTVLAIKNDVTNFFTQHLFTTDQTLSTLKI